LLTRQRHPDPALRARITTALLLLVLLWPLLVASEFKPWELLDSQSLAATGHFLSSFFPPAHSADFLWLLLRATWQTIAIATAGLSLALLAAIPLTLLASDALSISLLESGRTRFSARLLRQLTRWLLIVLRSVPELVWALLLVRIVGLGATAGVLAIALTYSGMLGKVYAEILEASDSHAAQSLLKNGASRLAAFVYGTLPNAAAELISYTAFRWECALRGSVVMGFVGAGGIGQSMDEAMKMLAGDEVCSMLLVLMALVAGADKLSSELRKRFS
jgi:phosphonate transport system permease protein